MGNSLKQNTIIEHVKKGTLEFIQFKNLQKYEEMITHCFTTRRGGVSTGECESLNLGLNRNDSRENVEENYKRICKAMNIKYDSLVLSRQVHDNKIRIISLKDLGKGITRENDLIGYDGFVTATPGITLVTFYADCTPIFLLDPIKKVICLAHSGWRGTIKEIAREAVGNMINEYGCLPEDIEAAIGPAISQCCFEVDEYVYREFQNKFSWINECTVIKKQGKWNIDLQEIIQRTLLESGLDPDKICISGVCTRCNNDLFFSHRGDGGKTGSLAAIMQLKEK